LRQWDASEFIPGVAWMGLAICMMTLMAMTGITIATEMTQLAPSAVKSTDDVIFEDDFEDIAEGVYPSAHGWTNLFSGKTAYVSTEKAYSGNKSFRLEGYSSWARMDYVDISPLPGRISYEAAVYIVDASGGREAGVGFMEGKGSYGRTWNHFFFSGGNITFHGTESAVLQKWEAGKWYKVRADIDFVSERADVYVDGELKAKDVPVYPREFYYDSYWGDVKLGKWGFTTANFEAGGTNVVYFDAVKITEITPPVQPEITITTDKTTYTTGDTMTITIDIANPTEDSVTFQWYWVVPQFSVCVPVMSVPISGGYDDTIDFSFTIPDRGSTPFGNVFYTELTDASGEVLDADVTWWAYSPSVVEAMPAAEVDIEKEIKKTIEKIE
jgi:hypothetical protein